MVVHMQNYKYELRESSNHVASGVIQAQSLGDATAMLRGRGYLLNIAPAGSAATNVLAKLQSVNFEFGPGLKDVMSFTNQLAVMIKAGINIRNAIGGIAEQIENRRFRKMIEQLKTDVESGKPFSEALSRYPKTFSPLYINMVKASELSGNFGHMLERITMYLAQQVETRSMVRGAMIYPAIIGTMAIVTTVFLLTFVLPRFTVLFKGKDTLLPLPTKALVAVSDFMRNDWYVIVGVLAAMVWGTLMAIRTEKGRYYWDWLALRIPLLKRMLRAMYITRGLHTMGELVNAGVPMLEVLSITAEVSGNIHYKNMWRVVHQSVKQGLKICQPLQKQGMLPRNVIQMISAGEESGKLGEVLRDIAEFYAKELKSTIKTVTAMIEPIMIVFMGGIVGFIAMSIILPIFKMSSLVKH
jgi:type IV pilus assembly protein PilC